MPAINFGMLGPAWKETGTPGGQQFAGNAPIVAKYRNGDTNNILPGDFVFMAFAGNAFDGVDVVWPSTAVAANANNLIDVGICVSPSSVPNVIGVPPKAIIDIAIHGTVYNAKIIVATRAATSNNWPTFGGLTIGDVLAPEVTNNGVVRTGTGATSGGIFAGQTIISLATQLSSFTSAGFLTTATALYVLGKVYLRRM